MEDESFKVTITGFCSCGWLVRLNDAGRVYCINPRCAKFSKLYDVTVIFRELTGPERVI